MNDLITNARPATLPESGYARAAREHRPWYVIYRPSEDEVGITPTLRDKDEIIIVCEPEVLSNVH